MPFGSSLIGGGTGSSGGGGTTPPTDTTTVEYLINATLRELNGMHRAEWNKLATTVDTDDESVVATFDLKGIAAGSYVGLGNEILYVWDTTVPTKTLTVQRAMLGSTRETHDAGDLIEVNPRFPRFAILAALRDEIRSWIPNLYRIAADTFTLDGGETSINLDGLGDILKILDVSRVPVNSGDPYTRVAYRIDRHADTDTFDSGTAIHVTDSPGSTTSYRIVCATPFDVSTFDETTYLVDDIGLAGSMFDIAPLGAAWRLLATREVKRTFTEGQGEPRIAQEVPPGHILQAATGLKQLRDQRIAEEAKRLALTYAPKMLR